MAIDTNAKKPEYIKNISSNNNTNVSLNFVAGVDAVKEKNGIF